MIRVLITGAGSYIGVSFEKYLSQWRDNYCVETLDMLDVHWKEKDFSLFDVVFHVAGIAHVKEIKENKCLYYSVNRDLAVEVAEKAYLEGVRQFIFMSSMSVYGLETGVITSDTIPAPKTNYGAAKLEAESGIRTLENDHFKVCILRPPMVYGKGCKGNFNGVVDIVKKVPVFPKVDNQRSMLYIDNLCSFVKKAIDEEFSGLFFPQNSEYMNTTQLAKWIGEGIGKKMHMSVLLGLGVKTLQLISSKARKGFGTLIYKDLEKNSFDYCVIDSEESVKRSI